MEGEGANTQFWSFTFVLNINSLQPWLAERFCTYLIMKVWSSSAFHRVGYFNFNTIYIKSDPWVITFHHTTEFNTLKLHWFLKIESQLSVFQADCFSRQISNLGSQVVYLVHFSTWRLCSHHKNIIQNESIIRNYLLFNHFRMGSKTLTEAEESKDS